MTLLGSVGDSVLEGYACLTNSIGSVPSLRFISPSVFPPDLGVGVFTLRGTSPFHSGICSSPSISTLT